MSWTYLCGLVAEARGAGLGDGRQWFICRVFIIYPRSVYCFYKPIINTSIHYMSQNPPYTMKSGYSQYSYLCYLETGQVKEASIHTGWYIVVWKQRYIKDTRERSSKYWQYHCINSRVQIDVNHPYPYMRFTQTRASYWTGIVLNSSLIPT